MTICFLQLAVLQFSNCLQCTYATVCGLWLLWHRLREAVCVEGNSTGDRRVALGPQTKQGPPILREFLGLRKYTLTTAARNVSVLRSTVLIVYSLWEVSSNSIEYVGQKLSTSHAAPWWVTVSMLTGQTEGRMLYHLPLPDAASIIIIVTSTVVFCWTRVYRMQPRNGQNWHSSMGKYVQHNRETAKIGFCTSLKSISIIMCRSCEDELRCMDLQLVKYWWSWWLSFT